VRVGEQLEIRQIADWTSRPERVYFAQ